MNKLTFIYKIIKDRWLRPYDQISLRFNTKADENNPLLWRVIINNQEMLASSFEIHGYVYDVETYENGVKKFNAGCMGRVRWEGTKAIIFASKKPVDNLV